MTVVQRFRRGSRPAKRGQMRFVQRAASARFRCCGEDPCHVSCRVAGGQADIVHVNTASTLPLKTALLRRALRYGLRALIVAETRERRARTRRIGGAHARSQAQHPPGSTVLGRIDGFASFRVWPRNRTAGGVPVSISDRQPVASEVARRARRLKRVDPDGGQAGRRRPIGGDPALLLGGSVSTRRQRSSDDRARGLREQSVARLCHPRELSMIFSEGELLGAVRSRIPPSVAGIVCPRRVVRQGRAGTDGVVLQRGGHIFVVGSHHEGGGYTRCWKRCAWTGSAWSPTFLRSARLRMPARSAPSGPAGNWRALADADRAHRGAGSCRGAKPRAPPGFRTCRRSS